MASREVENRTMIYITGPKAGQRVPDSRIYERLGKTAARQIVIKPGNHHNERCFVIYNPHSGCHGFVVHFWYDTTGSPAVRVDHLRTGFARFKPRVTDFENVESDAGRVQIGSENGSFEKQFRDAAVLTDVKDWADGPGFARLGATPVPPALPGQGIDGVNDIQENGAASANDAAISDEGAGQLPQDARVVELGDDIRVIFVPRDGGHRVYMSFRGTFSSIMYFPREWLWPPVEAQRRPAESRSSMLSRLKGLLK
jgi:hypothetical protein